MQFPGSFDWPKGRESLPSLPKLTQGVKEMFPLCDGRSGVVKCSLAISLGRPGEPRVMSFQQSCLEKKSYSIFIDLTRFLIKIR